MRVWGVIAWNDNVWDGQRGVWQADRESQAVLAVRTQRESLAAAVRGAEDLPQHPGQRFVSCCCCCLIDKSGVFGQCAEIESAASGCCVLYNLSSGQWWVWVSQWLKRSGIGRFKSFDVSHWMLILWNTPPLWSTLQKNLCKVDWDTFCHSDDQGKCPNQPVFTLCHELCEFYLFANFAKIKNSFIMYLMRFQTCMHFFLL